MINIFCFIKEIIVKNLEDLNFCKKFLEFQYVAGEKFIRCENGECNNIKVKIEEIIDKMEDFFVDLEEAGKIKDFFLS